MNQEFFDTTLKPFLDTLLDNFEKEHKKSGKNPEDFFEEYFNLDSSNLMALKTQVLENTKVVTGSNYGLYPGVKPEELVKTFVKLFKEQKERYLSTADFYRGFFIEGESNTENVRLNRRLFAEKFDNTVLSLNQVQKERKYSKREVLHFKKLLIQVLGEARFKVIENQVFIGEDQIFISADLQLELEMNLKKLLSDQLKAGRISNIDFNMRDLQLKADVATPFGDQTILADGSTDPDDLSESEHAAKIQGIETDLDIKIRPNDTKEKTAKKKMPHKKPQEAKKQIEHEFKKGAESFKSPSKPEKEFQKEPSNREEAFNQTLPYTKLPGASENISLDKAEIKPKKGRGGVQKKSMAGYRQTRDLEGDSGNISRKMEYRNKARRYTEENKAAKESKPRQNPKDARSGQDVSRPQFRGDQKEGARNFGSTAYAGKRKQPDNTFKKIMGVSAALAGVPVVGSLGLASFVSLKPAASNSAAIAGIFNSMNEVVLSIIHFFV